MTTSTNPENRQPDDSASLDGADLERDSLAERDKDELIEIIIGLKNQIPKVGDQAPQQVGTAALKPEKVGALDFPAFAEFADDTRQDRYIRLPARPPKDPDKAKYTTWRFRLLSSKIQHKPLMLEVYDDVVIGRPAAGSTLHLDLSDYDPDELGISRQHALLRPAPSALFLVDLNSTNGTFCNQERLMAGLSRKLNDGDVITFGKLHFTLKIISRPK